MEMALTQLVINMRYALMSLSLSQKFARSVHTGHRLAIAYDITDEIFAVASSKKGKVGQWYMYGLIFLPVVGWVSGTLGGAVASTIMPEFIRSARTGINTSTKATITIPAKKVTKFKPGAELADAIK